MEYNGEWDKKSSRFDDEDLRRKVDYTDLDKDSGLFYCSWAEWNQAFQSTNLIVEANNQKYCHSGITMVDFKDDPHGQAFFEFTLSKNINCDKEVFAINANNCGPRLQNYKIDMFEYLPYNFMLMTADGKFVTAGKSGSQQFMATLLVKEGTLKAGKYILRVDPQTHRGSQDNDNYKKVVIDFYCSQKIKINRVEDQTGMNCVRKCLRTLALSSEFQSSREAYLAQNPGMENVFRVNLLDAKKSAFGILYNRNETDKTLT